MLTLKEKNSKAVIVCFGRFQPPTIGHLEQVKFMAKEADARGVEARLYTSHTNDAKKNPLTYEQKIKWLKKAFGHLVDVEESPARTIIEVLAELYKEGFTEVYYTGGSDREGVGDLVLQYNGKPDKSGNIVYSFDVLEPLVSGQRVEGISGTDVRNFVKNGDFESFEKLVPFDEVDAQELFYELRDGLGIKESLREEKDPIYKKIFRVIKPLFTSEIERLQPEVDIKTSSAHEKELMRIGSNILSDVKLSEDELKALVTDAFDNLKNSPIVISDDALELLSIGDYRVHGGSMSSGSYNAFRIDANYISGDVVTPIDFYISIIKGKNSNKKGLAPNKVLNIKNSRMLYNNVGSYLLKIKNEPLLLLLKKLFEETAIPGNVEFSPNLYDGISYLRGDGTCPTEIYINLKVPEAAQMFNDLGLFDTAKSSLAQTINVDLVEILGGIALSNAIAQSTSNNGIYIQFPQASNEKIIDYTIYEGMGSDDKPIKVSAKTDAGGKASSTGLLDTVIENSNIIDDDSNFCRWFKLNHLKVHNTQGHKNVADKFAEIVESKPSLGSWEGRIYNVVSKSSYLSDVEQAVELYHKIENPSYIPTEEDISQLIGYANNYINKIDGSTIRKQIFPSNAEINKPIFIKNKAIFCLCKLFVNSFNRTNMATAINRKFQRAFGGFIQIYCTKHNLETGDYSFNVVFVGNNNRQLRAGSPTPYYELIEDCANTPPDGEMIIKKIALDLKH